VYERGEPGAHRVVAVGVEEKKGGGE